MAKTPRPVKLRVHLTPEEHAELRRRAILSHRPVSRYVREAALAARVVIAAGAVDRALIGDLKRIANNVNQLAREANSARAFPAEAKVDAVLGPLAALIASLAADVAGRRSGAPEVFPTAAEADAAEEGAA
ncbi:hypothetical protein tb265_50260 [Gemmatimonadetes bacterium T265]|nr:hypothetical protein tb265_50260 [Gemmatimonadetes bacterium T265]